MIVETVIHQWPHAYAEEVVNNPIKCVDAGGQIIRDKDGKIVVTTREQITTALGQALIRFRTEMAHLQQRRE